MSPRTTSPFGSARRNKPRQPLPSPRRRTNNKSKPVKTLRRCSSAPLLTRLDNGDADGHCWRSGRGSFFRPKTFSDAFLSSPSPFSSPRIHTKQVTLNFTKRSFFIFINYYYYENRTVYFLQRLQRTSCYSVRLVEG